MLTRIRSRENFQEPHRESNLVFPVLWGSAFIGAVIIVKLDFNVCITVLEV